MIDDFIKILSNAGLEPTAIDIAEMLLLAAYLPSPMFGQPISEAPTKEEFIPGPGPEQNFPAPEVSREMQRPEFPTPQPSPSPGDVFIKNPDEEEDVSTSKTGMQIMSFRAPAAPALPGAQKIARSLRPFRRHCPSNHRFILDEEKTIQQIAEGGPQLPVMKPATERWLDVALVFDQSLTMQIWRPTLDEIRRLFEYCGLFRDVRTWRLNTDGPFATLQMDVASQASATRGWRELLDPARRRLIVIVSDCHAESWRNGDTYRLLADWGARAPVALAQVLPERFWPSTTMTPVDAVFRAQLPVLPNPKLQVVPSWYQGLIKAGGTPLPVVTLDEWSIAPWARMVAGSSGVATFGLIIPPLPERAENLSKKEKEANSDNVGEPHLADRTKGEGAKELSPKDRVKAFFTTASPVARQLTRYLASAPLSLPVMRLVQQAMLPQSRQSHLAEVFLSGLIYQPAPKGDREPIPDEIIFEFRDDKVRDLLINQVTKAETVMVIETVSRYLEQRLGEGGDFGALLAIPGKDSNTRGRRLDPLGHKFAQLSVRILRRFGGYDARVARIEQVFMPDSSDQSRGKFPGAVESVEKQFDAPWDQPRKLEIPAGADLEIYISYAHLDNQPLFDTDEGWVDLLHKRLEIRLAQLLGEMPKIWRYPKLKDDDSVGHLPLGKIHTTALMISVLSPQYLRSDGCLKELSEFYEHAQKSGSQTFDGWLRILKIIKTPVSWHDHPIELRDVLGYEFYELDAVTGRYREFSPDLGGDHNLRYWEKLEDLAWAVKKLLEKIKLRAGTQPATTQPLGKTIYLAETTSDLIDQRERIRRELIHNGHRVLPDRPLPLGQNLREAVNNHLAESHISIHLIGTHYGFIPESESDSLTAIQFELATDYSRSNAEFSEIVWIPVDFATAGERQQMFIHKILNNSSSEVFRGKLEDLKTLIHKKLSRITTAQLPPVPSPSLIYLICDKHDYEAIMPIEIYLLQQGFEVRLLPPDAAPQMHRDNLLICDAVLVYCGQTTDAWLQKKSSDLIKHVGYGRTKPMLAKGFYIGAPQTSVKDRFRTQDGVVIRNYGDFTPDSLSPFTEQIKRAKGTMQ